MKLLSISSPECSDFIKRLVELAPLRPARHRMRKEYIEAYFKETPPSDPGEDQDDRNALYCL